MRKRNAQLSNLLPLHNVKLTAGGQAKSVFISPSGTEPLKQASEILYVDSKHAIFICLTLNDYMVQEIDTWWRCETSRLYLTSAI
jgi:hypothetical protein